MAHLILHHYTDIAHELSGQFIKKYGAFFEIPSNEDIFAVMQVARGHRKTDLFDPVEYPVDFKAGDGSPVCLPYLAALIRLADEIDITQDRSDADTYRMRDGVSDYQRSLYEIHQAIKKVETREDAFVIHVETADDAVYQNILEQNAKIQETLDYCRAVVAERTNFCITQRRIECINNVAHD